MKDIVIFGADIMAKMIHFYFSRDLKSKVVAFTVDRKYLKGETMFMDLPLIPFEEIEKKYPSDLYEIFIAIGPSKMNSNRELKFNEVKQKGYEMVRYISPYAVCDSDVGENTFIGDMAVINPFVEIGCNNLFWENTFIGNDSVIGNHCFFAPKCVVSTYSRIEDNVVLGTGSIVKTSVKVAKKTLVGAASYISDDTLENGVYGEKNSQYYGNISEKINISSVKK